MFLIENDVSEIDMVRLTLVYALSPFVCSSSFLDWFIGQESRGNLGMGHWFPFNILILGRGTTKLHGE